MPKADSAQKEGRHWRDLDQSVNPRTLSDGGRRRFASGVLQWILIGAFTALIAWGGWEIANTLAGDNSAMSDPVNAAPLREIVLINDADGVLNQEWLEGVLAVKKNTPLMELDLTKLREKLLALGQVRAADLRREFPGTLVVVLHERRPVLRVVVQSGDGARRVLYVARDGMIYDGIAYDAGRVGTLPYLDGVRLVRSHRGGYQPIEGMENVADLLQTVQTAAPGMYLGWKSISLARLTGYDEILVRTRTIPELVFSRKHDFTQQLAYLDRVVDETAAQPNAVVKRVDLSLGSNVYVAIEKSDTGAVSTSLVKPLNPRIRRDL
jgi:hypothetical protein